MKTINFLNSLAEKTIKPMEVIVVDQTPLNDRPPDFYKLHHDHLPPTLIGSSTPSSTRARNTGAKMGAGPTTSYSNIRPGPIFGGQVKVA